MAVVIIIVCLIIVYIVYANINNSSSQNQTPYYDNNTSYNTGNTRDYLNDEDIYSIESIRSYYNVSQSEINRILRMRGIIPQNGRVSKTQYDVITADILCNNFKNTLPNPIKKTPSHSKTKIITPPPRSTPIEDKGHKIVLSQMTNISDTIIRRSAEPQVGSKVFTETGKVYTLVNSLGSGGEGTVYDIDSKGSVAKIYDSEHSTMRRYEKIKLMVKDKKKLKYSGICIPSEMLFTEQKEFIGYVMPKAQGSSLQILFNPAIFQSKFPNWKKSEMIELSITILKKIKHLHGHDVIIGDINPRNILVVSHKEVYFVDTDSYQYKGFPCPVGTPEYTAKELQGVDFRTYLRTQGNENFTVAMLLFRLMMQGQSPYAYQGGGNPVENIIKGTFPYAAYGKKVPDVYNLQPSDFRFVWSHLMKRLKEAFWDTFHKNGSHNTESTRYSVSVWLEIMHGYHTSLPKMMEDDSMSGEIFPTRLKRSKYINYRVCSHCGEEKAEDMFYDTTTCKECHEKIRKEIYTTLTCSKCGRTFYITNGEYDHYTKMGFTLPKRCPDCRNLPR